MADEVNQGPQNTGDQTPGAETPVQPAPEVASGAEAPHVEAPAQPTAEAAPAPEAPHVEAPAAAAEATVAKEGGKFFGQLGKSIEEQGGRFKGAFDAAKKTTFSGEFIRNNKLAFAGKTTAMLGGAYIASGAFKSKNPDGSDRGVISRAARLTLGGALAVGGAVAGAAR